MDLNQVSLGLGIGASAAAVVAALWALWQLFRKSWERTVGGRRSQARILDQLACGSSLAFAEARLGVAQFVAQRAPLEQRIYRLPGAWVLLEVSDDTVRSFSITITDPSMHYPTERLTFGRLAVELGKDTFTCAAPDFNGERLWIGARRMGYLRHYYFGNPGGYQNYWLSYNMSGAGTFPPGTRFASGDYSAYCDEDSTSTSDTSSIVVNTLTVVSPEWHALEHYMERDVLGPDHDLVRLSRGNA
ncbi:hypothetical protein EEB14_47790 [Rhodococcus sp. WS4]|nr:hypothetical protein EEB14_47790 [Rhodococcus sp. WS4]